MGFFDRKKKVTLTDNSVQKVDVRYQQCGSPLVKISGGDITKPYINDSYIGDTMYVSFGQDNLYPQLIDQMYYQSPLHSSIIDFQINAALGGGFEIEYNSERNGREKIAEKIFLRQISAKRLVKGIALDMKMHKRCHILITKDTQGTPIKAERILPSKVRYNRAKSLFFVSNNWLVSDRTITYPAYNRHDQISESVLSFIDLDSSPGQDTYPLDKTISIFNWCYLDGQSSTLQKNNIQRSIFGSLVVKRPKEFENLEELELFKAGIAAKEGEVTPILILAADGKENLPEVEAYPANQNDKAFENMDKRIDDKICQAHSINPVIMGIERPGALGSGSDIIASYPIWEKNVVLPFRDTIEEVMFQLMEAWGIRGVFNINPYRIIDGEVLEVGEEVAVNTTEEVQEDVTTENIKEDKDLNVILSKLSTKERELIRLVSKEYRSGKTVMNMVKIKLKNFGFTNHELKRILRTKI